MVFARSISASASALFLLLLVCAGIRDAGSDLPGHQIDKAAIADIDLPVRIEASDKNTGGNVLP